MDYRKIYKLLVDKARSEIRFKSSSVYYEAHHIIPRCFGGEGNTRSLNHPNIILLTLKEHYIAHLLLTRIYPNSPAMWKALWSMCNVDPSKKKYIRYKPGSNQYQYIRSEYIKNTSGINNPMYGKKHTKEILEKMRIASLGNTNCLGHKHTEESKRKMSESTKGQIITKETRLKISNALKGGNHYNAKPIECLTTGNIFGSGKELSEYTKIPFSTIRGWLNGTSIPPDSFHYKRTSNGR